MQIHLSVFQFRVSPTIEDRSAYSIYIYIYSSTSAQVRSCPKFSCPAMIWLLIVQPAGRSSDHDKVIDTANATRTATVPYLPSCRGPGSGKPWMDELRIEKRSAGATGGQVGIISFLLQRPGRPLTSEAHLPGRFHRRSVGMS